MEAPRSVVLVEGASDQRALEALAERCGRNLAADGVTVVAMGGAQAIGEFLERFGPSGLGVRLAGLCDAGEEGHFRRALERAGLGADLTRSKLEQLGFFVCVADLEDELIRSLGVRRVERVLEAQGDLAALRTFQQQPGWRGRAPEAQLRRFIGTSSGRKIRMGAALVHALDLARVPPPLAGVLAHVAPTDAGSRDRRPSSAADREPCVDSTQGLSARLTAARQTSSTVTASDTIAIRRLDTVDEAHVDALARLLVDAIDSDAGVSFLHPLEPGRARAFWRGVAEDVASGARALLVAEDDSGVVGTVQLVLAQPENQPHRADLSKMLVHRRARRRGLGAALLHAAEQTARACGKTLLVLDTNTGSDAERLYARNGWVRVGEIPGFSIQPRGGLRATTVFYKQL